MRSPALFLPTALACILMSIPSLASAQEVKTAEAPEYAYGEVISVDAAAKSIVISEYSFEEDKDVQNTYIIDDKTAFVNAKGMADIKAGDYAEIDYTLGAGNKRIAKAVYIEEPGAAEEIEDDTTEVEEVPDETP